MDDALPPISSFPVLAVAGEKEKRTTIYMYPAVKLASGLHTIPNWPGPTWKERSKGGENILHIYVHTYLYQFEVERALLPAGKIPWEWDTFPLSYRRSCLFLLLLAASYRSLEQGASIHASSVLNGWFRWTVHEPFKSIEKHFPWSLLRYIRYWLID